MQDYSVDMQMNIINFINHCHHIIILYTATDPPQTPLEEGDQQTLVDTVSYYIQTCWLLQL